MLEEVAPILEVQYFLLVVDDILSFGSKYKLEPNRTLHVKYKYL